MWISTFDWLVRLSKVDPCSSASVLVIFIIECANTLSPTPPDGEGLVKPLSANHALLAYNSQSIMSIRGNRRSHPKTEGSATELYTIAYIHAGQHIFLAFTKPINQTEGEHL